MFGSKFYTETDSGGSSSISLNNAHLSQYMTSGIPFLLSARALLASSGPFEENQFVFGNTGATDRVDLRITTFAVPTATPVPPALPLFATGLSALGLLGWRRKRKASSDG